MIEGYFNRFDAAKEYESHLFRAGHVLQSAELNEIQYSANNRIKGIGDALFKDGDIVRDAGIIVNPDTGAVTCQSGAIYLTGTVRGVPAGSLTIPTIGIVTVGVYLQQTIITELQDPNLRDPADLTQNYGEPGAARQKLHVEWGFSGDSQTGEFFPVYTIEDGVQRPKEAPPNMDSVTQAIASYDRDSAGSSYVVSGLVVSAMADLESGEQVYSVAEGRARVNGYGIPLTSSRRIVYAAAPDLRRITNEPKVSTTVSAQRITLDRAPSAGIVSVSITAQKTVTVTHGGYTGVSDPLPDPAVLDIVEVKQGGTTYVKTTDYRLTAGNVDWSPAGAEPATGSTYQVTYKYQVNVTPTAVDETGFTVTGAIVGTTVLTTYDQKLPRIDRLALNAAGVLTMIKGVAADYNPQAPGVPADQLLLATITQTWGANRTIKNDSVRVVPMSDLSAINARMDYMLGLIAQQRLAGDVNLREAGQKKGIFVDPLLDDSQRDAGVAQTAAIFNGEMTLPVAIAQVAQMPLDVTKRTTMAYSLAVVLDQPLMTGSMLVNPYQAFEPLPAQVTLTPAIDTWTVINTSWGSAVTERVTSGSGNSSATSSASNVELLSSDSRPAETLRPIEVKFSLSGFGPNELLSSVVFDGIAVTPTAI